MVGRTDTSATRVPHGSLWQYVLLAVLAALGLVALDMARTSTNPLNLVQPGLQGPSIQAFREDFPDAYIPDSDGLDGQQFYAVARNPFDLGEAAEHLDRPRYRLQRPLLSWLAWLGHPGGGGTGLIVSFFLVGVAAVAALATAVGALGRKLGGSPAVGAAVGVFPGVWWSLRVTVADTLATALALGAIALLAHGRSRGGIAAGVLAVLAKETAVLVLIGWLLANVRDRQRWYMVASAALVAAAWAAYLRIRLPGDETVGELTAPFVGFFDAIKDRWLEGDELWGLLGTSSALAVAVVALAFRGVRHPLAPAIVLQLVFLAFANGDVIGNDFGAGRSMLPLLALSTIAVFARGPADQRDGPPSPHGSAGMPEAAVRSGGESKS